VTATTTFNNRAIMALTVFILFNPLAKAKGLTAEAVLGDYRSDPLFGEAAAQKSIIVEVGENRFAPNEIQAQANVNISFVFTNSSKLAHLMVMAYELNEVINDQTFINSYLEHGTDQVTVPGGHSHGNSSSDDASPMVKLIDEHPAVFIKPGETKEVLVRFENTKIIQLACVLDEHHKQGFNGFISPYIKD